MHHRHLDTQEFTLAAIDDIISRGSRRNWIELRDAVQADPHIAVKVKKICDHYADDGSIRYDFWPVYLRHCGYAYLYTDVSIHSRPHPPTDSVTGG